MRSETRAVVIVAGLVMVGGCSSLDKIDDPTQVTDQDIDDLAKEWDGRRVEDDARLGDFQVSLDMQGRFGLVLVRPRECQTYGWTQVVREFVDKEVVDDPTKLTDPPNEPGKRARWKREMTDDGWHVDGGANSRTENYPVQGNGSTFTDAPHMPLEDLRRGFPGAKSYVMQAETCVRCVQPKSDYFACFEWLYVRLAGREQDYIVTKSRPSPEPSDEFNDAVAAWLD